VQGRLAHALNGLLAGLGIEVVFLAVAAAAVFTGLVPPKGAPKIPQLLDRDQWRHHGVPPLVWFSPRGGAIAATRQP
jgi:hypothetical protein